MTNGKRQLPQQPHIEHLKKEAKQRFALLRARASGTRLADAQYWLAQDYGFVNWRALKEEVLRRMGVMRMAPLPVHNRARFRHVPSSVDEELEADGYFQRGAAVTGIGLIAALAVAAMALLFAGRALGQTSSASPTAIAMSPERSGKFVGFYRLGPKAVFAVTRDGDGRHLVFTYGTPASKISGVAILDLP
jgi:hypothetical protein